jgi:ABC-type lipoprotein export system ATPase subunit
MPEPLLTIDGITKTFHVGTQDVQVLKGISFTIEKGDFMVIFGPSGCGKSTLLHQLLGLEEPTTGSVTILGKNIYNGWLEDDRSEFRKEHIGMVYQQPNWIKSLTVAENVSFPLLLLGTEKAQAQTLALEELKVVNMQDWAGYLPGELSSGQQQKVSLARAMITNPEIIVADEPTGNLDFESGEELMKLLVPLTQNGKTVIMVTHDLEYLKYATRALKMFDGLVTEHFEGKNIIKNALKQIQTKRVDLKVQ